MKNLLFLTFLLFSLFNCNSGSLILKNAGNEDACNEEGAYWYNGKCWTGFEDEGIAKADIDQFVKDQMVWIEKAVVSLNGNKFPLQLFMPSEEGKEVVFITVFEDKEGAKTILQTVSRKDLNNTNLSSEAILIDGNIEELGEDESALLQKMSMPLGVGKIDIQVNKLDELDLEFRGTLNNPETGKPYQLTYQVNEAIMGAGTSKLEVKGDEIHINGDLGTRTYAQLKTALREHPSVKTVVLGNISGSLNDAVNMHTGRLVREAGLHTKVLKTSVIASGAVDLFCAGKERFVERGAKLGIHSWCCLDDLTAAEIPEDHPAHQYQVAYFTMCLGKDIGPKFYFHTLTSAPFDGVHWMSEEEIREWSVATQIY